MIDEFSINEFLESIRDFHEARTMMKMEDIDLGNIAIMYLMKNMES